MKLKRILALTIAVILVIGLAAGCGSSSVGKQSPEPKGSEPDKKAEATPDAKPALDPYELNWYVVGDRPKDAGLVEEELSKYLTDKINATIKMNFLDWGTYNNQLNTMLASGEYLDLCFTCSWFADVRQNAIKGGFLPLDDLLAQYAPKTKALLGDDFVKAASINGKLYAIPTLKEKAQGTGVMLKKDLIDKYQIDLTKITKLEDLEPYFEMVKNNEPNIYAVEAIAGADGPNRLNADIDTPTLGCNVADDGKTIISMFDNPRFDQYIKLTRKYYNAGYIRKDAASIIDVGPDEKAGKYFCMFPQLKPGKDVEMSVGLGYEVKQINFGKPVVTNGDISGSMQGIARASKNPERAMMFLELLFTDPYVSNLVNNGIEDKHYKKIADNTIDVDAGSDGKDSGYRPGFAWMHGNVFTNYLFKADAPDKLEQYKKWNESATLAPSVAFVFNPENVLTEVGAMGNLHEEFKGIYSGGVDIDTMIPKYKERMKAAGHDKVIAELQRQFDEYLKTR